jgi:hypothetical protein
MLPKSVFAIQGFRIGAKNGKSLALVIPSPVVKEFGLSPETVLAMKVDQGSGKMTIEVATVGNHGNEST